MTTIIRITEEDDIQFHRATDSQNTDMDPNPNDTTTKGISLKRVALFVVILVAIFVAGMFYQEALYQLSHEVILSLAETTSESQLGFYELLSELTEDHIYIIASIILSPLLSRERFWYYILGMQFATITKSNIKMIKSEPRPAWVWSDVPAYGCATSFGSPSGHSTRAANIVFMVILDVFFASSWSRKAYPHLNKISIRSHPVIFSLLVLLVITFWPLIVYDRIVLGKHTLNQVLLGSQTGIWCAFFSHYVLRDFIFSHVRRVTSAGTKLDSQTARSYIMGSTLIVMAVYSLYLIVGFICQATHQLQQTWLINLRDTCGEHYEVDADGNLIANSSGMYTGTMVDAASVFGIYGLFLGQILFRSKGYGKLYSDAYTSKAGVAHQAVFMAILFVLVKVPYWVRDMVSEDIPQVTMALFVVALPTFIVYLVATLYLPALGAKLASYPEVFMDEEEDESSKAVKAGDDAQKQERSFSGLFSKSMSQTSLIGKLFLTYEFVIFEIWDLFK